MKAILISIKPEWIADILNGQKTIEIRKTAPKCDLPIDVYIYCTKDPKWKTLINRGGFLTGMVVAKFTLQKVVTLHMQMGATHGYGNKGYMGYGHCEKGCFKWYWDIKSETCLDHDNLCKYLNDGKDFFDIRRADKGAKEGYAWHISDLIIFDEPKALSEFGVQKAPQSWQYIEV